MNIFKEFASAFGIAPALPKVESKKLAHPLQAFGYRYAMRLLDLLVNHGLLDADQIQTICDFGAGTGGPTLALRDFFKCPTRNLTALESYAPQVRMLQALLPEAQIYDGDGLDWLSGHHQRYDLITAFMLGPDDEDHQLVSHFLNEAIACLKPNGKLIIGSDVATMHGVLSIVRKMTELRCDWLIPEIDAVLPVTVVIAQEGDQTANNGCENIILPEPIIIRRSVPDVQHHWETETYCLSTAFEKLYLQATIDAFIFQAPEHPAIPVMQALLATA